MAPVSARICLLSALLVLVGSAAWVNAKNEEADEEEATVETIEEEETYLSPTVDPKRVYLTEHFDEPNRFPYKWVKSEAKKQGVDDNIAKYDGKWQLQQPSKKILKNDLGLVLTTEAKHAAISALLDRPFEFRDKPLVVQYEVTMQEGQNCGGAYIKLLSRGGASTKEDLRKFHDQTPYTIMFGPDKCGNDNKLHFIFRHQNPINGSFEEKHSKKPTERLEDIYKDKEPHLYTLVVRPDNTFTVLVDSKVVNSGSLLEDFTPPVNPPEEIDDPEDRKPEDWDEREKIVDPTATKPDDWDESEPAMIVDPNAAKPDGWLDGEPDTVPDPAAKKPEDWDDEMDGEWEAPLIDNPLCAAAPGCGQWSPPTIPNPGYKGTWHAPLVANPNYKGKWAPRRVRNPHYFRDDHPFRMTAIHAVGFELWSMSPMLLFDNLIVTDDPAVAQDWAQQTFELKRAKLSRDKKSLWGRMMRAMNYNPGWWALYAIYVAIPVSVYVAYLVRRAREASVLGQTAKILGDNPWIFGAVIVGACVVLGLIVYMCCWQESEETVDAKKTDAFTQDDMQEAEPQEGEQQEGEEEEEGEGAEGEGAERPGKAHLEGPAPEPLVTETTPLVDTEGAGDGQRKRKPRKE